MTAPYQYLQTSMTTRELIQHLQTVDPGGNSPVVVNNAPVRHVDRVPSYYDGYLEEIGWADKGSFSPMSARWVDAGVKVRLLAISIRDAVMEKPDLEVVEPRWAPYRAALAAWRKASRDLEVGHD